MMSAYMNDLKTKEGEGEVSPGHPSVEFSFRKIRDFNALHQIEDQNKSDTFLSQPKIEDLEEPQKQSIKEIQRIGSAGTRSIRQIMLKNQQNMQNKAQMLTSARSNNQKDISSIL